MMYCFDVETFAYDWIVVFKHLPTGEYHVFHNDNYGVREFINNNKLYVSFNGKHYDLHILRAILAGADNVVIKQLNDWIIDGKLGWDFWFFKQRWTPWFNVVDIRDDMYIGLGLKDIEAHLGMNIEETSVPFDIDRPLLEDELKEVIEYCKYDVDMVERMVHERKDYLKGKLSLGRMKGITDAKSLYATNAKMTAMFLGAERVERNDERDYKYPPNLRLEVIPQEVKDFYARLKDSSIPDEEIFWGKDSKIDVEIAPGVVATYGYGGIHQALDNYMEESTEDRVIVLSDVGSFYPSLMIHYGYVSRNIPSEKDYVTVYWDRMKAKEEGNKEIDATFKLVLNTTYGAMLNKYNELYDPLMARSVCISGQLFLTDLTLMYLEKMETVKIIQMNTDGVIISFDREEWDTLREIHKEWQDRTKFTLDEVEIRKIVQKDCNNYVMVGSNGRVTTKGAYVTYGISPWGAWNVNNNYTIVKKAIIEYFVNDVPVEETILNCDDILEFQFVAKGGGKYDRVYHIVDGKEVTVQKTNRVYASTDLRNGTLYKVHKETGKPHKIPSLPQFCVVDNKNELDISQIDKGFYVDMAKKMVRDYLGIKPKKINRRTVNRLGREALGLLDKKGVDGAV